MFPEVCPLQSVQSVLSSSSLPSPSALGHLRSPLLVLLSFQLSFRCPPFSVVHSVSVVYSFPTPPSVKLTFTLRAIALVLSKTHH